MIKCQRALIILSGVYSMKNNLFVLVWMDSNRKDNVDWERIESTSFSGWVECNRLLSHDSVTDEERKFSGILLDGGILE